MLRKFWLIAIVAAGTAGCASAPVVQDNTPLNQTAVIQTHVSSNGIKGVMPFETDDTVYVRADRERKGSMFKGTGTFTGFLLGSHSGIKITRLDRDLVWKLNPDKKEYTQCPLTGCPLPEQQSVTQEPSERPQQHRPPQRRQPSCTMRVSKSVFKVTPTGKQQNINGFDTHEYQVSWVVTLRDPKRRTSTSRLDIDTWTTSPNKAMRDAMAVEAAYKRAHAHAVRLQQGSQPELLPGDATKLIMAYLARSLNRKELQSFMRAGRQMRKVKGHPILTKVTWDISGSACSDNEQQQAENSPSPSSPSDFLSGLGGLLSKNKDKSDSNQSGGEPLLSLTVEVKQYKVAPEHDSLFQVPADYQKVAAH